MSTTPLLTLNNICRQFQIGKTSIPVLKNIHLKIHAGEMIAIMGASGSGKSTLMNILGCMDRPTSGQYLIDGQDVHQLNHDELAQLRRERFGFIFQRYHLIPSLSVIDNIEVPALYAHSSKTERQARAQHLLTTLGLSDYGTRKINQLSGGQQQRISIARALMNGGEIILADEPTGALDSQHGREVMQLLQKLHHQGHTVIIITHDPKIAQYAQRIIHISDGKITSDQANYPPSEGVLTTAISAEKTSLTPYPGMPISRKPSLTAMHDTLRSAWLALRNHRLRTSLTLLGITIGIVSVVSLNAIGEGAKRYITENIGALGRNVIGIYPGNGPSDDKAAGVRSLLPRDLTALANQSWVTLLSPAIHTMLRTRWQHADANVYVNGTNSNFLKVNTLTLISGRALLEQDVEQRSSVVVIDNNLQKKLFPENVSPLGQVIFVGSLPCRVIGVARSQSSYQDTRLSLWMPWSTVGSRLLGRNWFDAIIVSIQEKIPSSIAERAITTLLTRQHGQQDFFMINSDEFVKSIEKTNFALTLFLSVVALISLIVGGIGVMNIMLVSVTERTRETGIRMAVGARRYDIRLQFLNEAVLICLMGAFLGIVISFGVGKLFSIFVQSIQMIFSFYSLLIAVTCAVLVGILSGWFPALQASRLDPAEALTRE